MPTNVSRLDEPGAAAWWISFLTRLPRYKFLLRKRWWILAITVALGLLAAAWRVASQPMLYTSTARLVVSGKVSLQENASYSEEVTNFFGTQIEWMRSGEISRRAQERVVGLYPGVQPGPVKLDAAQFPRSSIFVLTAIGASPEYTRRYLDAVIDEYMDARKEMRSEKSENVLDTLTDQLSRYEKEMRESEQDLLDFQKQNNIASLQEASTSAGSYLIKLNGQLADLKNELQLLQLLDLDQTIERRKNSKTADDTGVPAGSDPAMGGQNTMGAEADYLRAKQEIEVLKSKRTEMATRLKPKHPDMVQINQDIQRQELLIGNFRTQTMEQLKTRRESISIQIKNLDASIKEWETKALDLNQKMAEYNRIKNKGDRAKASYDSVVSSSRSVDVSKNIDQEMVSVMERASGPEPARPGLVKMAMLGLFAGMLVGIGILFLLDKIDDRMNSFGEFQAHFSENVLAKIPRETDAEGLLAFDSADKRIAFVESMRALRSSIFYLPVDGAAPKTLLITSAVPNEGKSTIATNLAVTLSFAGSKVLLIDGDLRRGTIHEKFGMDNSVGIGDVFKHQTPVDKAVRATKFSNLFLMARGANLEHPGENYLSKKTDEILKGLYQKFDYIIIDSSPVLVADDTTSLAPKIDAVIFVLLFSFSSARRSREAIELLKKRQANLIGIICNGVDVLMQDYYYNKYPEYYAVKHDADA